MNNGIGGMDVANLVAKAGHTPGLGGVVNSRGDVGVESGALLEDVVKRELADFGSHRGLGELGDSVLGIFNTVASLVGVKHSREQNAVQFERHIVGSNGALAGNFDGDFLQILDIGNTVDKGHEHG